MKTPAIVRILGLFAAAPIAGAAPAIHDECNASLRPMMPLEDGWKNPPRIARTRVWWWWLNGNTDKETITRDLEAMKANGIGGANIIDAGGDSQDGNRPVPHGPDFGSAAWRELFRHALAEAERLDLEMGFNIQSGWNLGGPSVPISESSKRVTFSQTTVTGGGMVEIKLPQPAMTGGFYQDVAVLALPAATGTGTLPDLEQKAYFKYPGSFTATAAWHLIDPGDESPDDKPCPPEAVIDLTKIAAGGDLRWPAPPGNWQILRFGYTASGSHVSTHSENAGGHAIDYLDRQTLDSYWQKTLDPIFAAAKPHTARSLRYLHTDSWELGPVNWTRIMPEEFKRLRGYEIHPWLPVLAGRIIGNRDQSTRFLNDFRRTLADLMAENKYAGFAERAHALGMGIHPESGGPHAGPMDALLNLGISDIPMGEFWSTSPRHRVTDEQRFFVKQTTSAAHTYGRRVSLAEAFTNIGRYWQHDPRSLKPTFDQAACEGHNLTMWHTFPSSAKEHGIPGAAYFAGEHFNPNVTWWSQGAAFIAYMNRCHFMLQQGLGASDVLHYQGENIPAFVRLKRDDPAKCLPGYDYDVIDARALLERVRVDGNGHAVLPEGTSYRMLSLVPHDAVSLPVMRHLAKLVADGLTLVGPKTKRPYSLSGGKAADAEFQTLCDKLWGDSPTGERRVGKGRVVWGKTTREVLKSDGIPQAFTWTGGDAETHIDFVQRRTDDAIVWFVANRNDRAENVSLGFRVSGRVPEFWDPVTGSIRNATNFREEDGVSIIPRPMHGHESFFVIFRKSTTAKPSGNPNVTPLSPAITLDGPWKITFDTRWGGPGEVTFDTLTDWTWHKDKRIRFYSGTAVYRKTFDAPQTDGPLHLDLGMVESLCEVKLNGKDLGVLWSAPFRTDVSGLLRPSGNQLEIKVVNLWCNRLIGDASLPENQRLTRTNITKLTPNTPLEPSGLLGPVRLLSGKP
jgi:hypothetical protein